MRATARTLRRLFAWSVPAFVCFIALDLSFGLPHPFALVVPLLLIGLYVAALVTGHLARPRTTPATVEVVPPVEGTWTGLNGPADRVPSHGTHTLGQTYAIDVLIDSGRPTIDGWWPATRPATDFPSFGAPILSVGEATVVRASDGQRDHRSRNSYPGLLYLFGEGIVRSIGGPGRILGNHVILDLGDGVHAAYAHLKRGSVVVREGDRVTAGQRIGACGNSGNSSEPHLHFQLMDHPEPELAHGVPFRWTGVGVPANGESFTIEPGASCPPS